MWDARPLRNPAHPDPHDVPIAADPPQGDFVDAAGQWRFDVGDLDDRFGI
jgi:hypothetical protein